MIITVLGSLLFVYCITALPPLVYVNEIKGLFMLLNTTNYPENAMVRWLEGNNNTDHSLLTSYKSFIELSLTGKSNSSRKIWIVAFHRTSTLGFSAVKEHESHNIFTKIFLRSHLWTPPHFHSLQLSPEESFIKLSEKSMYIWCWINVFPWWIYWGTFTLRFLPVNIFLAFHIQHLVCTCIYHMFRFQLKHMLQVQNKSYSENIMTETFHKLNTDAQKKYSACKWKIRFHIHKINNSSFSYG